MNSRQLFGTDGIRGIANVHPMTCEVALSLGRAVAYSARSGSHRHRIVVGKDTRLSCYMLEMAVASGICSMGADALLVGPMPTPAVAFLTHSMRADAGVVISASHNPYQDNGIKLFARDGFKLPDADEAALESMMSDADVQRIRPTAEAVGKAYRLEGAPGRYLEALKRVFPTDLDLDGLKLVVDCANGAGYKVAPTVFQELGAEVISIGDQPNGRNINAACGALHPELCAQAIVQHGADLGIALDGDGDRLVVLDHEGRVMDGDTLLAIAGLDMLDRGTLNDRTMVTTVMANLALDRTIEGRGGQVLRTQVGDRYVVEAMRERKLNFGGENSGHVIFLDHATTGDGLVAALNLLAVLRRAGAPLKELASAMTPFPQALVNVEVVRKVPLEQLDGVCTLIGSVEAELGKEGRVMVRYSGTEPKARVLVEGPEAAMVQARAQAIADALRGALS